jgi:hypothetical protein
MYIVDDENKIGKWKDENDKEYDQQPNSFSPSQKSHESYVKEIGCQYMQGILA